MGGLTKVAEQLAPWVGGGAVFALAVVVFYLWLQYHQRESEQHSQQSDLIQDIREERNHWREQATTKQNTVLAQRELISELRSQNAKLDTQNGELNRQNEILQAQREALEDKREALEQKVESLAQKVRALETHLEQHPDFQHTENGWVTLQQKSS